MARMPRITSLDSTPALLRDPYRFISKQCQQIGSDVFQARIMLRPTICMSGPDATRLFYDPARFVRKGAPPEPLRATLFGKEGVQVLDDDEHRRRKRLFTRMMTPDRIAHLTALVEEQWRAYARSWASRPQVTLYDELREMLARAVCAWAGVPLSEEEVHRRTRDLTVLFDSAASFRNVRSRAARKRAERWAENMVRSARKGTLRPSVESALHAVTWHGETEGGLLTPRTAAIELLNILRPTVAVSVYMVFVAHALHQYRESRERLAASDGAYAEYFVQEVRRFYPFFPSVAARVREGFEWQGLHFPQGRRVILDLYGTNHDARSWPAPDEFRPERFSEWDHDPFNFVPQGGGDPNTGHRCPGEGVTVALMKVALDHLLNRMTYDVPDQDLEIDYRRLPALPRSRFIISNVRLSERSM